MVAYSLLFPVPLSSPGRHLLPSSQAFPGSTTFVKSHHRRRRSLCYRVGRPTAFVNSSSSSDDSVTEDRVKPDVFGGKKQLSGLQTLVDALPPPARLVGTAMVVAGALVVGYGLGLKFGGSRNFGLGGAVALGAAGVGVAYGVNSCVPDIAATNLHNLVAGCDDPTELTKEDIEEVAKKCGVSKHDEAFSQELCDLYSRYFSSVLPPGGENLKGDEVEKILKFKKSLGIDDADAASVHMEIGRRIFRERLETGDHEADVEQRRAFQKLIYVSTLIFGEAAKFLLPWKRLFKVTDSQVEIAIRDNAQRLYASMLNSVERDIDEEQLISLRESQLLYKLSDEIAADMLRERTRKLAEENIKTAIEALKSRVKTGARISYVALVWFVSNKLEVTSKDMAHIIEELEMVLAFNESLTLLSKHCAAGKFAVGIGPISLLGGEFDNDRKLDDLKLLYRAYAAECFQNGRFDKSKIESLNHLKNIFGLGKREAEGIMLEVSTRIYRKRLSQAVSSGDLDNATSKAAFLQNLCDEIQFDPVKASQIHGDIYRNKLKQCIEDGELSEDNVSTLLRTRVMLCIPQETVDVAHADICGTLFEKVVKDAIASGVEGYDANIRASVRKASQGLRLSKDTAMTIANKAVRKVFMNYIQRSRGAGNRMEAARELKKMIAFNTLVVTELVTDIKGESPTTLVPVVDEQKDFKEDDEWESLQTLKKTRPNKELEAKLGKPGQTEITLKDDLQERDRSDLYRTYLLYCLSGESTVVPFGVQITTKKDNSEFLLLNQLGGILGLTGNEIVEIHRNLAEQAFMKQAEVILADGQLTKARVEQLNDVQKQVGLPAEYAQKIIKDITTTKMAAAIETAVSKGRISIKQVRELKEASIDLDSIISERLRENLFKKTVDEIFSSGSGEFDEEDVYERIPNDLSIDQKKAKELVHELARNRLSNSLVQAVASLRQRNREATVSCINDILACDKAVTAEPFTWTAPEELADLYCVYLKSIPTAEKLTRLQYLLRITDVSAAALRDSAERGELPVVGNEKEEEEFAF